MQRQLITSPAGDHLVARHHERGRAQDRQGALPVTLPLLAQITFSGDAGTCGRLTSAMGTGAVIGGLVVARRGALGLSPIAFAAALFTAALLAAALFTAALLAAALLAAALLGRPSRHWRSRRTSGPPWRPDSSSAAAAPRS